MAHQLVPRDHGCLLFDEHDGFLQGVATSMQHKSVQTLPIYGTSRVAAAVQEKDNRAWPVVICNTDADYANKILEAVRRASTHQLEVSRVELSGAERPPQNVEITFSAVLDLPCPSALTQDVMRELFRVFREAHGAQAMMAMLGSVSCRELADLDPSDYRTVIKNMMTYVPLPQTDQGAIEKAVHAEIERRMPMIMSVVTRNLRTAERQHRAGGR
jgi:hypothetical protein